MPFDFKKKMDELLKYVGIKDKTKSHETDQCRTPDYETSMPGSSTGEHQLDNAGIGPGTQEGSSWGVSVSMRRVNKP